jgi:hypothetical protein
MERQEAGQERVLCQAADDVAAGRLPAYEVERPLEARPVQLHE